jgi:hypothetical protein
LDASAALPETSALSGELRALVAKANTNPIVVTPKIAALYATAAVEMWQRGVHSFLVSVSLTGTSPVWSSVSGYYASHYCVRGFAHLLGYFQLYQKRKCIVQISIGGGKYYCQILAKSAGDREHKFYWKIVKRHPQFAGDDFFTINPEDDDVSDSAYRATANYADHVDRFPNFQPLNQEDVKTRIKLLSAVSLSSAPIPNRKKFPDDVKSVQLVAYHRLIRFREFLDGVLGGSHTFWKVHRNPSWSKDFLDFQVTRPRALENSGDQA